MNKKMASATGHNKKRGNRLGFWFFKTAFKIFGQSGAYGLLYIVCIYYLIFDTHTFWTTMAYIKRRFKGHNIIKRIFYVYQILVNQGKNLIDRYILIMGYEQFDIELLGYEKIKLLVDDSKNGFILITAHIGNWQVAMTALEKFSRTIYLLMRDEDNTAVREALHIDKEEKMVRIISPESFLGGVMDVMKVLSEGKIVAIMGDRVYGHNAAVHVSFLGDKVHLPYSAFTIAAALQCPVVVVLSAKISKKKYIVDVSHVITPCYKNKQRKKKEIASFVQEFAKIMENFVFKYPFQWSVFNDIWKDDDT